MSDRAYIRCVETITLSRGYNSSFSWIFRYLKQDSTITYPGRKRVNISAAAREARCEKKDAIRVITASAINSSSLCLTFSLTLFITSGIDNR
ncbi:MAG: hypothetical protein C4B56_08095 [Candidatus Methanophagaceae archaeon]|nr:MAG: hypothetical protein C4B56_08095 [Methanophagales archaeon]